MHNKYEVVIGMEIHAQLKTKTKMFCACAVSFGAQANTNVCPICMGLPGTLPTVNAQAIALAIRASLALNCQIRPKSTFARKHYFYPDLPKGYQITQYKEPLAYEGFIEINRAQIRIRRLHLEEDSGKSIHAGNESLVDFNRCGVPLIEIVTEPNITSPDQAVQYLHELRQILNYLEVSDCDMEKGHFRCEPNISLRPIGQKQFGVRTELKNLNSLRNVREGLEFEINRQTKLLNEGKAVQQETLYWDEQTKTSGTMRTKEESEDYRYFPEPDLPVMNITEKMINTIKSNLPLLPAQRKQQLIRQYQISPQIAEVIIETKEFADYYDATVKHCPNAKLVANWLTTEVRAVLNQQIISINDFKIKPQQLAQLLNLLSENKITGKNAKQIFEQMVTTNKSAQEIAKTQNLLSIEDDALLTNIAQEVIRENPDIVTKYRQGKTSVIGYLTGLVVKKSQGKLNPQKITRTLQQYLNT
ncbi:MAG: Asp-tRNA(Asn)/Glu-tRNA(Gln) amidotransferase subunit GatB [Candidatus Latescibacteria bacterium]|nr:Asp-tRNA(Asn)/Glu-tRNA(Gln) amidotransferase subunit GatB [Candidatus Latescibacterota bacterium]